MLKIRWQAGQVDSPAGASRRSLWTAAAVVLAVAPVWAGVPQVSDVMITDVTDRSLSVVWNASEASTGSLLVFDGPECTVPTEGAILTPHPVLSPDPAVRAALRSAAEGQGIQKVQAVGLKPSTSYCVQTVTTSQSSAEQTVAPATPLAVTTQARTARSPARNSPPGASLPFSNEVLKASILEAGGASPVAGAILLAEALDLASHPVSGYMGDGIGPEAALVDLNNLYGQTDRQSLDLLGGERVRLVEYRGTEGCTLDRYRKVPADQGLGEVRTAAGCFNAADVDCNDTVNILDIVRDISGFGQRAGTSCFNSDMDLNRDSSVDILDIVTVINRFGLFP